MILLLRKVTEYCNSIVVGVFLAVCLVGAEAVSVLSNRVATTNVQARFRVDKDTWPPGQPHSFTPLLLVHHEGQQRMDQAVEVAKLVHKGDVTSLATEQLVHTKLDDHASHVSKVTKEVTKILTP